MILQEVLDHENPDLFKWLTGQLPAPEELTQNEAFQVSYSANKHPPRNERSIVIEC